MISSSRIWPNLASHDGCESIWEWAHPSPSSNQCRIELQRDSWEEIARKEAWKTWKWSSQKRQFIRSWEHSKIHTSCVFTGATLPIDWRWCSSSRRCQCQWNGGHSSMPVSWENEQMAFDNQQNLKFHHQGGINALPSICGKLGTHDLEMPSISHCCKCRCCWNGSHSPCPHHGEMLKSSSMKFNVNQPG
jgi:hypothetical protein